ncbi:MAG: thioredoxin [Proteobacteria bacterium]|nr:thioredoxin [Pseudomonadota bacterium]NLN63101.1 thioredoxin [Myxococcales bacterium]
MGILNWLGIIPDCEREPLALTDDNFDEEVRRSDIPVVVDIWSHGCAPCAQLVPTVKRLACKYEGKVKIAQLNAASAPQAMRRLNVRGTPTLLFFKKGGQLVERVVGVRGQHYFEEIIDYDLLGLPLPEEAKK